MFRVSDSNTGAGSAGTTATAPAKVSRGRWRESARSGLAVFVVIAIMAAVVVIGGLGGDHIRPVPRVEPNVPVTMTDLIVTPASNSPLLIADPTEDRFVVIANRLDSPDFGCSLQLSGDSGQNWLTVDPVPELPSGAEKCYAPEAAFDRFGVLYYLFVGLAGKGNSPVGAFLTTSVDRGRTFTPPRQVLGAERYAVRMAMDTSIGSEGRIHLVWLETSADPPLGGFPEPPNPIMAAYSDNGGRTFSPPKQVSDPERDRVVAPVLTLGSDGKVHVLYYDLKDDFRDYQGLEGPTWEGKWSLVLTTSTDGGDRFGPGVVVDEDIVPPGRVMLIFTMPPPSLVADPAGNLYAAWHDSRNGDWDVFMRRSPNGGRSWESPRRVNDDPLHNGRHQYLPQLSVAPGGRVDVIFYDRRDDERNRGNDVFYTFSTDSGRRFNPNVRLTSRGFDSEIGPQYAVPSAFRLFEFGSRLALLSRESTVLTAWTDTRNTFRGHPAQDLFATEVILERPVSRPAWAGPAGVGLAVAAVGVLVWGRIRVRRRHSSPTAGEA